MMPGDENDPRAETSTSTPGDGSGDAPQTLSQADLLGGSGLRGALFAQWGRQKRRNALQQRYGEEADALLDEFSGTDLGDWTD